MTSSSPAPDEQSFSAVLQRAAAGDADARRQLWADNYVMLHECVDHWYQRAWQRRGEDQRISLCAGDIVDEVYCRLVDRTAALQHGRDYFFRAFYNECLRVAIDHYRHTRNDKGRGERGRVEMESCFLQDNRVHARIEVLADIVDALEKKSERMGQIARLKVFDHRANPDRPGTVRALTNEEIAELVGVATRTVEKDWKFAKAYLLHELEKQA